MNFQPPLLAWYRKHHRKLPWRTDPGTDPGALPGELPGAYHVLVSEAMLQQTQVATVVPYFERFVEALPGVADLAAADEQRVLHLWQGLGYYRRARNLHAAARMIVDRFAGQVPRTVEELLTLPGVGRYTAGAIASIAFDVPAPILDGNVARILARLNLIREPVASPAVRKQLWALAEALVTGAGGGSAPLRFAAKRDATSGGGAGAFNQAMMELGALICTPRSPRCLLCPVAKHCRTRQAGIDPQTLPVTLPRKTPKAVTHHVAVIEPRNPRNQNSRNAGKYLFEQRPATGLWSNMWQLPTAEAPEFCLAAERSGARPREAPEDLPDDRMETLIAWVRNRFGLVVTPAGELDAFTHQTTHRTIRFVPCRFVVTAGRLRPRTARWLTPAAAKALPMSNPQRKIVANL